MRDGISLIVMVITGLSVYQGLRIQNAILQLKLEMYQNFVSKTDFDNATLALLAKQRAFEREREPT